MVSDLMIKELFIGNEPIRLILRDQTPWIEYNYQLINHISILCEKFALLNNPVYITDFAQISNFLWKGLQFHYIDQIADFQKNYLRQVELEQRHQGDVFPYRLTDYKIFDVSVMHEPRLIDEQLHYYVCQTETRLPYRVVCPFPYLCSNPHVHYQILPILLVSN